MDVWYFLLKSFVFWSSNFNVSRAFDTVWHEGLLFKQKQAGIPDYLFKAIKSFMAERTFQVKIGPTTS